MPYPNFGYPYQPNYPQGNVYRVKGRDGADAFIVQPNCDYILMDEDENVFYFIHVDAMSRRTTKVCDFTIRDDSEDEYATKADLAAINKQLADIIGALNAQQPVSQAPEAEPKQPKPASTARSRKSASSS